MRKPYAPVPPTHKTLKCYYDKGGCHAIAHVMWAVVSLGRCVASQRNWSRNMVSRGSHPDRIGYPFHKQSKGFMFLVVLASVGAIISPGDGRWLQECKQECNYQHMKAVVQPYNAKLERMAWCESTHRWHINTRNGFFGGLQFDKATWKSVGGKFLPHKNRPITQKYRAVKLIKRSGYGPWPRCGSA